MLIWGWRSCVTRLAVVFAVCGMCRHEGAQVIDELRKKFTFFFVPLFTTSTKYVQQCTLCAHQTKVTQEYADQAAAQTSAPRPFGTVPTRGQDAVLPVSVAPEELASGTDRQIQVETGVRCPDCDAGGSGGSGSMSCPTCSGQGRVRATRTLQAHIPAGASYGQRVVLRGEGEVGAHGGPAGDVYLELVGPDDRA